MKKLYSLLTLLVALLIMNGLFLLESSHATVFNTLPTMKNGFPAGLHAVSNASFNLNGVAIGGAAVRFSGIHAKMPVAKALKRCASHLEKRELVASESTGYACGQIEGKAVVYFAVGDGRSCIIFRQEMSKHALATMDPHGPFHIQVAGNIACACVFPSQYKFNSWCDESGISAVKGRLISPNMQGSYMVLKNNRICAIFNKFSQ